MKYIIYLGFFFLFPFLLIGQQSLINTPVTVLMKNKSKLAGVVKMEHVHSLELLIDKETYTLKKSEIIAVIPGNVILEDLENEVLKKDLIVLKNKVWISVEIIEIGPKSVHFTMNDSKHVLPLNQIAEIYPKGQKMSFLPKSKYEDDFVKSVRLAKLKNQYEKTGFYHVFYGSIATRNSLLEEFNLQRNGFGLQYVFGYQISQNFGLGLGLGYLDYFGPSDAERLKLIPIFTEARGYLSQNKTSAYYSLAVGVTTGTKLPGEFTVKKKRPGLYTHPAIGYKIGSNKVSFLVDFGFQLSNVKYEIDLAELGIFVANNVQFIDSRRIVFRLGIMF